MLNKTLIALTLALTPLAFAQDGAKVFKAGASLSNITPWIGTSLAGSMADRKATRINDELYVRSFVMDDGATTLSISLVDSCMVERPIIDAAKERASAATGITTTNMLVAATHSHSAGTCATIFQSKPDPEFTTFVSRRIADGITRAWQNRVPARIGWASGSVPDEVFNRRWYVQEGKVGTNPFGKIDTIQTNPASDTIIKPAGPTDSEVAFIALETIDGKPLGLLANYSLHYVGAVAGASADYFGLFSKRIAELLNPTGSDGTFVAAMSNGTSGDINNINFPNRGGKRALFEQITVVGNKVAAEVHRAYGDVVFQDWVPLAAVQKEVSLGVRKPTPEEVTEAKDILAAAEGRALKGLREIYANCTVDLADYPDREDLVLQALQIGDLGIAAIPCEVFVEIGLAIKDQTPFGSSFTISLANGYNGYLPTEAQHALGGYETWRAKSSHLEVTAANVIQATVLDLLGELKK